MVTKLPDGNGGKWVVKKKFALALFSLLCGYGVILYVLWRVQTFTIVDLASLLGAMSTYTLAVLGPVYAADVVDKRLNGGQYDPKAGGHVPPQ